MGVWGLAVFLLPILGCIFQGGIFLGFIFHDLERILLLQEVCLARIVPISRNFDSNIKFEMLVEIDVFATYNVLENFDVLVKYIRFVDIDSSRIFSLCVDIDRLVKIDPIAGMNIAIARCVPAIRVNERSFSE